MRSAAAILFGVVLAAVASYAQADLADAPERVAGTLTCLTRPDLSLVVGRSPVAECAFAGQDGTLHQDYVALLPEAGRPGDVERSDRIVWRVWTRGRTGRDARFEGTFRTRPIGDARAATRFAGENAELELVSHSSRNTATFTHGHGRVDLATR